MAKGNYKYTLTGITNYEDNEVHTGKCYYLDEKELCADLATELRNNTKATSYLLTIVCHKKATKIPQ